MRKAVAVFSAFMGSILAWGADYVLTNVTDSTVPITTAANYEGGAVPTFSSTDGLANVLYATNATTKLQQISTHGYTTSEMYVGSLVGDANRQFAIDYVHTQWGDQGQRLNLADVSQWPGLIWAGLCKRLCFHPTNDTGVVHQLSFDHGVYVSVVQDKTIAISNAFGLGYVTLDNYTYSTGGSFQIADPQFGEATTLVRVGGGLSVAGHADETGVVGDPYLHLDATVGSSLVTEFASDKTFVTKWTDCRGGEGRPYAYASAANFKPFLGTDPDSRKQVVDFGAALVDYNDGTGMDQYLEGERIGYTGYTGVTLGKTAWMKLNAACPTIREVFLVVRNHNELGCYTQYLGTDTRGTSAFQQGFYKGNNIPYPIARLFANTTCTEPVRNGDIRLDGSRVLYDYETPMLGSMHVLSVGTSAPVSADRIANNGQETCTGTPEERRNFAFGGFKLGELLVYTNALTSAERTRVHRYLIGKWRTDDDAVIHDFNAIDNSAKTLDVPSDTLKVKRLTVAANAKTTKTGAGRLEISDMTTDSFDLAVNGGEVAFGKMAAPRANPQPAENPMMWIDAHDVTNANVMVISNAVDGSGRKYVSRWKHHENNGTNALGFANYYVPVTPGAFPYVKYEADLGGDPVVYFGAYDGETWSAGSESASMKAYYSRYDGTYDKKTYTTGTYKARTCFIVCKTDSDPCGVLSDTAVTLFRRRDNGGLFQTEGSSWNVDNAVVALDAKQISSHAATPNGAYHLISIRLMHPVPMNYLACDAWHSCKYRGGLSVAEYLMYERPLTEREVKDTEAYLMAKWLGKTHPQDDRRAGDVNIGNLTFADGVTPTIDSDRDVTVAVYTGTGACVKKGAGAAEIESQFGASVTGLDVEGGSLTLGLDPFSDAALHLDASREADFVWATDGESERKIEKWLDGRGNGLCAKTSYDYSRVAPTLKTTTDDASGLTAGSNYVDLGGENECGMYFTASAGGRYTIPMREMHVVFRFPAIHGNYCIIGGSDGTLIPWPYAHDNCFWYSEDTSPIRLGWKRLDGAAWHNRDNAFAADASCLDGDTFYVWTLQATNTVNADSIAIDRTNCGSGVIKICEVVIYSATNTQERANVIHEHLLKKWKGLGSGLSLMPVVLDGVTVANESTLNVTTANGGAISAGTLAGAGTVNAPDGVVVDADTLDFAAAFTSRTACDCLTFTGALTLPSAGTVTLATPGGLRPKIGFYPIFSAQSLTVDPSLWTLDVSGANPHRTYRLLRRGNALGIGVGATGAAVFVR